MKKILKIIAGFLLSNLIVYIVGVLFVWVWHFPVKVIFLISLLFMIILQIIHFISHFKEITIKMMGKRILITILVTLIITGISHISYGVIKNIEGQKILNNIEKIEVNGYILEKEKLKIQFVNDVSKINTDPFTTNHSIANVYYSNGNIESIEVFYFMSVRPSSSRIRIKRIRRFKFLYI